MTQTLRVLTWNVYHGRAVPAAGRSLLAEFSAKLAGWEWDVALLQEVPPWWAQPLAQVAGADHRTALTSRNFGLPIRRRVAERRPDWIGSNGGGADAILAREAIGEHRKQRLRWRPERRVLHAVRLPNRGLWVANLHAEVARADPHARDVERARAIALEWAGDEPLVFGGDLNHRGLSKRGLPGLEHAAGDRIDYVFVRGLEVAGEPALLEHDGLSDHAPIAVTLRAVGDAPARM